MCRRGPRIITSYERLHGIWLQKWSQIPKHAREDLDQTVHTMRKLLIYYLKNVSLKSFQDTKESSLGRRMLTSLQAGFLAGVFVKQQTS